MTDLVNLQAKDPFAEDDDVATTGKTSTKVHVRVQQRNGRKSITTIQGLSSDLDLKLILKELKKSFNCNGSIVEDKELGTIVQLQGDQRDCVKKFLLEEGLVGKENLQIHGF
eukprot:RCo046352